MEMPAVAANFGTEALPANRFFSLLRKSISAHVIYIAIVGAYYAAFCIMLRMHPDMWVTDMLLAFGGFSDGFGDLHYAQCLHHALLPYCQICEAGEADPGLTEGDEAVSGKPEASGQWPSHRPDHDGLHVCVFKHQVIIPVLNPYSWDVYFANLDKALHFGRQPWEWLHPLLGYPPITYLLNLNYNLWFLVTWMVWVYFAFLDKPSEVRTRFFLSFFTLWIVVGSLLAVGFSSVGPCFYGRLGLTPDPFADLMTYLRGANEVFPIWALPLQDELWQGYIDQSLIVKGISAMPSMHNGSALLYVLAGYQVSRFAGRILALHCFLVFIGSIHLGWHYAVDSYLAWAIALMIWFAVLPIARWWHSTAAQGDFDRGLAAGA